MMLIKQIKINLAYYLLTFKIRCQTFFVFLKI